MSSYYYGLLQYRGPGDKQKKHFREPPEPGTPQLVGRTNKDSMKTRRGLYPLDAEIFQSVQKLPYTLAKTNMFLRDLNKKITANQNLLTNT